MSERNAEMKAIRNTLFFYIEGFLQGDLGIFKQSFYREASMFRASSDEK